MRLGCLLGVLSLAACVESGEPSSSSRTASTTESTTAGESDTGPGQSETESGSETGSEPAPSVSVKWIEVAASDYKLELQPEFDPAWTEYEALADGPDISVYVDVIVNADVDGVTVGAAPATLVGFRTWRSTAELISPTFTTVEVDAGAAEVPIYAIDVTVPSP